MKRRRIAISTRGISGLKDEVSDVFNRTKTITIIDVVDGEVKDVQVLQNPAASYRFGAGPILVKTLVDMKVNVVVAADLCPGASALIHDHDISKMVVKPSTPVYEALKVAQSQIV